MPANQKGEQTTVVTEYHGKEAGLFKAKGTFSLWILTHLAHLGHPADRFYFPFRDPLLQITGKQRIISDGQEGSGFKVPVQLTPRSAGLHYTY